MFIENIQGALRKTFKPLFDEVYHRLDKVDQRLDKVDERLDKVDQRLDKVDQRLDKVDERLDKVDQRLDKVDQRLDKVDERFTGIDRKLDANSADIHDLHQKVMASLDGITASLHQFDMVKDHENRILVLEQDSSAMKLVLKHTKDI